MPEFDQTPDKPQAFGYKVSWFALKASDPAAVVDAFGVGAATPSNWSSGLTAANGDDPWLFVSPPIDGWIFAVGASLPYPVTVDDNHEIGTKFDALLLRLMKRFDDVQFFGSHRGAGFVAWVRALKGRPVRIFSSADDVMANVGAQSAEEAKLGFADFSGLSPSDASDRMYDLAAQQDEDEDSLVGAGLSREEAQAKLREKGRAPIPDESDVVDLAALWSIDPTQFGSDDQAPGLGLVVRLPENLTQ